MHNLPYFLLQELRVSSWHRYWRLADRDIQGCLECSQSDRVDYQPLLVKQSMRISREVER